REQSGANSGLERELPMSGADQTREARGGHAKHARTGWLPEALKKHPYAELPVHGPHSWLPRFRSLEQAGLPSYFVLNLRAPVRRTASSEARTPDAGAWAAYLEPRAQFDVLSHCDLRPLPS